MNGPKKIASTTTRRVGSRCLSRRASPRSRKLTTRCVASPRRRLMMSRKSGSDAKNKDVDGRSEPRARLGCVAVLVRRTRFLAVGPCAGLGFLPPYPVAKRRECRRDLLGRRPGWKVKPHHRLLGVARHVCPLVSGGRKYYAASRGEHACYGALRDCCALDKGGRTSIMKK